MVSNILKKHKVELTRDRLEVPSISSKIKPDASIAIKDDKIVFIEVLSETSVKTIRKLYHVLLLQLVYIRSVNKQTEEVSGFV